MHEECAYKDEKVENIKNKDQKNQDQKNQDQKNKVQKNKIENDFKFLLGVKFGNSVIDKIESQKYLHVVTIAQYFFHEYSSYKEDK